MGALPFAHAVSVEEADIDFMGHVNNARYLGWVQDAVLAHWQALAPAAAVKQLHWVALRHDISYHRPAFLGESIVATVLLERVSGARAFYEAVVRRGDEVLAEVRSNWCCVDAATHRPVRLSGDIKRSFLMPSDRDQSIGK